MTRSPYLRGEVVHGRHKGEVRFGGPRDWARFTRDERVTPDGLAKDTETRTTLLLVDGSMWKVGRYLPQAAMQTDGRG